MAEELNYLNNISNIINNGDEKQGRNGKTKELFGISMRFSLENNTLPLLTTKKVSWHNVLTELLFFINGKTDNEFLIQQNNNIWTGNTTREYLDSVGLESYPEGKLGPCFPAGTLVQTINGYKNIENIRKGEHVYTHLGNKMPVVKTMNRLYTGKLISIETNNNHCSTQTTPEHPFYVRTYEKNNGIYSMSEPFFVQAGLLLPEIHFVGMKIDNKIDNNDIMHPYHYYRMGQNFAEDYIPEYFYNLPDNCLAEFLKGFNTDRIISLTLALGFQKLYAKIGIIADILFHHNRYTISITRNSGFTFIENGYVWYSIKFKIVIEVTNLPVYNLSVLNDNTYTVNNLCVHNCYGFQWRNFNGNYNPSEANDVFSVPNRFDQLQEVIDCLRDPVKRYSRRLVVSAWNPCQINMMVLPPCHMLFQFNVSSDNKLSCKMTQRSGDMGLGVPYNIASYAFLVHLMAHHCGLVPGELIVDIGSAHIYEEHIEPLKLQLEREPRAFPTVRILNRKGKLEDYTLSDFLVECYNPFPIIKMKFIA